jgi:hypothetical protein
LILRNLIKIIAGKNTKNKNKNILEDWRLVVNFLEHLELELEFKFSFSKEFVTVFTAFPFSIKTTKSPKERKRELKFTKPTWN